MSDVDMGEHPPIWHARMAENLLERAHQQAEAGDPGVGEIVASRLIAAAQVHATLALRVEPLAAEAATLSGIVGGEWIEVGSNVTMITRIDGETRLQGEIGEVIEAHHADGEVSYYLVRWHDLDGEIMRHAESNLALVILPD